MGYVDMIPVIGGKTGVLCIIGDPVGHSRSPVMQNAAIAASGLDYVYVPFRVAAAHLERAVEGLRAVGVAGFNVTIPHKTTIIPFLDGLDESAEIAGAVNTVRMCDGSLIGHNTDGDGLVDALAGDLDFVPGTSPILLLGAGGAARGAIAALCRSGARTIFVANRSADHAESLVSPMRMRFPGVCMEVVPYHVIAHELLASVSLLLNTTSLGMKGECFEHIEIEALPKTAKLFDMVYGQSATPLVNSALQLGLRAVNGLGMLVAQGERAFEIWTGVTPPRGVMRRALGLG